MQAIESLRVYAIEVSHPSRQFGHRHFDQVLVAGHGAPGVAHAVEALAAIRRNALIAPLRAIRQCSRIAWRPVCTWAMEDRRTLFSYPQGTS